MTPFYMTKMGHKFYEADVPRLIRALERIATVLEADHKASQAVGLDGVNKHTETGRLSSAHSNPGNFPQRDNSHEDTD